VHITDKSKCANYGIIPFPETYQACVDAAIGILGPYMTDPRADNVILKCSTKNRKGEWVWADIASAHWQAVLGRYGDEVGVFEKISKSILGDVGFLLGKVYLTFGKFDGAETDWSPITQGDMVDRPKSFKVRVLNISSYLA
jgi:hypothetical protein